MNNKKPTDAEILAVLDDYAKSLVNLEKLGLVKIINGETGAIVTPLGLKVMAELDKQETK